MSILLNPITNFDRFIENKKLDIYSDQVKREIRLLSTSPDGHITSNAYGSAMYRIQKYPGDIDLIEEFKCCEGRENTIEEFAKAIKRIVKRILGQREHYFSEIKAGLDDRFIIDIGEIDNGKYYPSEEMIKTLFEYTSMGIFEKDDLQKILLLFEGHTEPFNQDVYDIVFHIIRNYRIIRWSPQEILKGKKELIGNKVITLEQALEFDTLIKLDEIAKVNNKFTEVTDVYFLTYIDNKGNVEYINHIPNELKNEIEKFYYSNMFYNPFKAVKRMFALSRMPDHVHDEKYRQLLIKLFPFISSSTSLLYQLKSELEVLVLLLQIEKSPPIVAIDRQINELKNKLASVLEIPMNELNRIVFLIDKIVDTRSKDEKIVLIEHLIKIIKHQINYDTITYLNNVGLNPLPSFVMPEKKTYNHNIVRNPESNPVNPMKLLGSGLVIGSGDGCPDCCNNVEARLANEIKEIHHEGAGVYNGPMRRLRLRNPNPFSRYPNEGIFALEGLERRPQFERMF